MQWTIWDEERKGPKTIMHKLPPELEGRSINELNKMGYYKLFTVKPEDYIPRFSTLLGSSTFEKRDNGDIYQTFPEADFSAANVRVTLKALASADASRILSGTDWYIIRRLENGKPIPENVIILRAKVREHLNWIEADIDKRSPRELVEYNWMFPSRHDEEMVNGEPHRLTGEKIVTGEALAPLHPALEERIAGMSGIPIIKEIQTTFSTPDDNDILPAPSPDENNPFIPAQVIEQSPAARLLESGQIPVIPPGDIRTMDEEARSKLDPEVRKRLEAEDIERQLRERGK